MNKPTLSVFLPNYNQSEYIGELLQSIINQSFQPIEVIIVDDCSTDNSIEIIEKFAEKYSIIRLVRNHQNQGAILTCKRAFELTSGDYVYCTGTDDQILPGLFENSMNLLKTYPEAGLCCSELITLDIQTGFSREHRLYLSDKPCYFSPNEFLEIILKRPINAMPIYDRTGVMRRSVAVETGGGFIPELRNYSTWLTHLVLAFRYGICYFPQLSAVQRIAPVSYHKTQQKDLSSQLDVLIYMLELLETPAYSDVKPYFQRSASLSDFPTHILRVVSSNPKYWSYLSPRLLRHISTFDLLFDQSLEPVHYHGEIDCLRAILLLNLGHLTEAREVALSILKYNPNHRNAQEILAKLSSQTSLNSTHVSEQKLNSQPSTVNISPLDNQRQERQKIANQWLNLPTEQLESAYLGEIGKTHQALLNSGIKDEALTDNETAFVNQLSPLVAQGFAELKSIQYLLAAMLYRRADQLPLKYERAPIPRWLATDYLKFMFNSPNIFQEIGEADNYYGYMQEWINYIHTNIFNNPESQVWQSVAWFFTQNGNFIPLYFNSANLRDIYKKRAEIMEFALKLRGAEINYTFPERSASRQKIRFGILKEHFYPQTETFAILPVFEYLNRDQFEIILYATTTQNQRLEKYCQNRADRLVLLPNDLPNQVQTIRADDLDILFIATNVTAVAKSTTLLALHRLARIQLTSFAAPVTTGMRHIDYYIAGKLTAPLPLSSEQYTEKLINLENSGLCFSYAVEENIPQIKPTKASWGANQDSVVFISGANFYKIIPELRETWAKIIATVPNSVLVLYPFNPNWTNAYPGAIAFVNNLRAVFSKHNIDPNRLILLKALPTPADIKECLKIADIYLDSYPYGGATSLVDPLAVGLPPVVMEGNALRFKQASGLLRSLSIPELITNSEETYIKLAVTLGNHPEQRQYYRQQIQEKMQQNPSFLDSRSYSAQIGTVFQELFQNWQANHSTAQIEISPAQPLNSDLTPEFINRLHGCSNLYWIDPSEQSIIGELRQIRQELADFWLKVPTNQLETIYQTNIAKAYQALMNSGFRSETLTDTEQPFLQELANQLAKGFQQPQALNYLLAIMPYFSSDKMRVADANINLPQWLLIEYQQFFEQSNK